jgi:hypothetical protein
LVWTAGGRSPLRSWKIVTGISCLVNILLLSGCLDVAFKKLSELREWASQLSILYSWVDFARYVLHINFILGVIETVAKTSVVKEKNITLASL